MKRLLALLTALLLCAAPACAWEVSDELTALASQVLPGCGLLDGWLADDRAALLVTDAEGQVRLALCRAEDDGWLAIPSDPLPEEPHLFRIADACLFRDTAMLLLEDFAGTVYFAGCARQDGVWHITLSTPLPGSDVHFDVHHAYDGCVTLRLQEGDVSVACRPAEGFRWLITQVSDTSIGEHQLWFGMPGPYYADVPVERDVERVDWAALPHTYEGWLPLVDASMWAVVTGEGTPLYAEDGSVLAFCLPAAPLRLLDAEGARRRVSLYSSGLTGWVDASALLAGEDQLTLEAGEMEIAEYGSDYLSPAAGTALRVAPGGEKLQETDSIVRVRAVLPGGWLFVTDNGSGAHGYLHRSDCPDDAQWLAEHPDP